MFHIYKSSEVLDNDLLTAGKNELSIVLCPSFSDENELGSIPDDVQKLINDYHLSPFTAKVSHSFILFP